LIEVLQAELQAAEIARSDLAMANKGEDRVWKINAKKQPDNSDDIC
jgi:hypothetical protein